MLFHEVDYIDQNGSVCYFDGQQLDIQDIVEKTYNDDKRVIVKVYRCVCPHGHVLYVQQHLLDNTFALTLRNRMFVDIEDYKTHHNIKETELERICQIQNMVKLPRQVLSLRQVRALRKSNLSVPKPKKATRKKPAN